MESLKQSMPFINCRRAKRPAAPHRSPHLTGWRRRCLRPFSHPRKKAADSSETKPELRDKAVGLYILKLLYEGVQPTRHGDGIEYNSSPSPSGSLYRRSAGAPSSAWKSLSSAPRRPFRRILSCLTSNSKESNKPQRNRCGLLHLAGLERLHNCKELNER